MHFFIHCLLRTPDLAAKLAEMNHRVVHYRLTIISDTNIVTQIVVLMQMILPQVEHESCLAKWHTMKMSYQVPLAISVAYCSLVLQKKSGVWCFFFFLCCIKYI